MLSKMSCFFVELVLSEDVDCVVVVTGVVVVARRVVVVCAPSEEDVSPQPTSAQQQSAAANTAAESCFFMRMPFLSLQMPARMRAWIGCRVFCGIRAEIFGASNAKAKNTSQLQMRGRTAASFRMRLSVLFGILFQQTLGFRGGDDLVRKAAERLRGIADRLHTAAHLRDSRAVLSP